MGTTAITKALDMLEDALEHPNATDDHRQVLREARAALAKIKETATTLTRLHLGDYVYAVRERSGGDWHHIDVTAWDDAARVLRAIAEETHGRKP